MVDGAVVVVAGAGFGGEEEGFGGEVEEVGKKDGLGGEVEDVVGRKEGLAGDEVDEEDPEPDPRSIERCFVAPPAARETGIGKGLPPPPPLRLDPKDELRTDARVGEDGDGAWTWIGFWIWVWVWFGIGWVLGKEEVGKEEVGRVICLGIGLDWGGIDSGRWLGGCGCGFWRGPGWPGMGNGRRVGESLRCGTVYEAEGIRWCTGGV